jgi:hypothetical protein
MTAVSEIQMRRLKKVKVIFTVEQAMKTQKKNRGVAVHFL